MAGGMTPYGRQLALAGALPSSTDRHVGFFTVLPDADGDGGTELTIGVAPGYERHAWSSWLFVTDGTTVYRANDGAMEWEGPFSGDATESVVGWGVWDAATNGNLVAFGPMLDSGGSEIVVDFLNGDTPSFVDQELRIGIEELA